MKKSIVAAAALLCLCAQLRADEGMWMVNGLSSSLVRKMQNAGLQLDGKTIYDVDSQSVSDAIVSMSFIGTGSMISPDGLLITNHHVAYGDVYALSTAEHNYLEDGFWAHSRSEEIRIPGKTVQFLRKIVDVTDEVEQILQEAKAEGKPMGSRKLSYIVEKKWAAETGLEASLSSMWAGSRYYLSLYEEYSDVRLVAAPPVSIAAFGGDIDNWEWPQHKGDFALYRVYGKDGKPVTPSGFLKVSAAGYKPGDFTMVLGYPGRTDRYSSSAKVHFLTTLSLPINTEVRGAQMAIIKKWMDADPAVRLMYSDKFFSLSNVQENQEGEVQCCNRFKVEKSKRAEECRMGFGRKGRHMRELTESLDSTYTAVRKAESDLIWFRETMVRGSALALVATRLKNTKKPLDMDKEYSVLDLRVEKDLFSYNVRKFYENVDSTMWGQFQKDTYAAFTDSEGTDYDALVEYLWVDGYMNKESGIYRFFVDRSVADFNEKVAAVYKGRTMLDLNHEYTREKYQYRERKKIDQYPDANSTMRLTYGEVGTFKRDGKMLPWQTFSDEILAKEDPQDYDFRLKTEWHDLLAAQNEPIPVNFITDNDITGGNSGSPVLNARGEVIGLAFDGNKESLSGDVLWTDGFNKCICVDIRYVLWILSEYAGMGYLMPELEIVK